MHRSARAALFTVLAGLVVVYVLVPLPAVWHQTLYVAVAAAAVGLGADGLRRNRPERRRGWVLILSGAGAWILGDLCWTVEQHLLPGVYPAPSDVVYLAAYLLLAAGALVIARARPRGRDIAAVLDAAIVTTGAAVLIGVFLITPLGADSALSPAAKANGATYPLGDLFLLGMIARAYPSPMARTSSYRLLTAALTLSLASDTWFEVVSLTDGGDASSAWGDGGWLLAYLLIAAAAGVPSMRELGAPGPEDPEAVPTRRRLYVLTAGLMLPGVVLIVDGATGGQTDWPVIGAGTILLSGLVLVRMAGLLNIVQVQARTLSALARSDSLTGAPNRRTWDDELDRAARAARERATSLCVAMLDLDRFKAYNDTYGHPAGDRLLIEAVAAWTPELPPGALLARYGGEEFAVLAPGTAPADLVRTLQRLREVTPGGQTFSAGVALWDPSTDPGVAVAGADEALYAAKRAGRDRILVSGRPVPATGPVGPSGPRASMESAEPAGAGRRRPDLTVVLQPIVDLTTFAVCGYEALARFGGPDRGRPVEEVFRRAHAAGQGVRLELTAVRAALARTGRPPGLELYVNASARAVVSPVFLAGLPADLAGVVVELSEDPAGVELAAVVAAVERLRERGARIALDDVGAGGQEFARLAALRPDVIKADHSLVEGCSGDAGRSAVLSSLVTYAGALGLTVCAEGVEHVADLRHLTALGVTHAQGHLLAAPGPGWPVAVPAVAVV